MDQNSHASHAGSCGAPEADAGRVQADGDSGSDGAHAPQVAEGVAGCASTAPAASGEPEAKRPPATIREFERAMRALGFTRGQAQSIARHGFQSATDAPPDEVPPANDINQLHAAAERLARVLKGH